MSQPSPLLSTYIPLVHFLGAFLGNNCEVVLHDTEHKENSVVAIANSHISGRSTGAPLTDLALRFVMNKKYTEQDWVMGYTTRSRLGGSLHSATYFIKDEQGNLAGMMCLNMDVSDLLHANQLISNVISAAGLGTAHSKDLVNNALGQQKEPAPHAQQSEKIHIHTQDQQEENFSAPLEDLTETLISQVITRTNIPPQRMTPQERMDIVRTLHEKGVFLLKGTVGVVAHKLASSEATIYRYLQKFNDNNS